MPKQPKMNLLRVICRWKENVVHSADQRTLCFLCAVVIQKNIALVALEGDVLTVATYYMLQFGIPIITN